MYVPAGSLWPAGSTRGHGRVGASPCQGELDMGLWENRRRAGHDGTAPRTLERMGDPAASRRRPFAEVVGFDLVRPPEGPGGDDARMRLLPCRPFCCAGSPCSSLSSSTPGGST